MLVGTRRGPTPRMTPRPTRWPGREGTDMKYTLHKFQLDSCQLVLNALQERDCLQDLRLCIASPTGTGKSLMQLYVQSKLSDCWIITPKYEIMLGMLDKLGHKTTVSKQKLEALAFKHRICTPIKFRNLLMKGTAIRCKSVLFDEGHHHNAETYTDLDALLQVPSVAYTASPYRGSPKSTKVFRDLWGPPLWAITYPEAAEQGYINIPKCVTLPLVDDDIISIVNGEFQLESVTSMYKNRLEDITRLIVLDKPTMVSLPGIDMINAMEAYCTKHGIPSNVVTADTDVYMRQEAFRRCIACHSVLLQINVVSEGVDLPIRRLIDCSPTMSPVKWIQQFGRITRPSTDIAEYICTNRNMQRHAYLLEGCLPLEVVVQSQIVFPPPQRQGVRVMGLECIGKFQPIELPLASGIQGSIYCVASADPNNSSNIINYAAIVHPAVLEPIWAVQIKVKKEFNTELNRWNIEYGDWERCEQPPDLQGFKSLPSSPITEKMKAWWKRSAKFYGLDSNADVTRKNFQSLPLLKDLKLRLT